MRRLKAVCSWHGRWLSKSRSSGKVSERVVGERKRQRGTWPHKLSPYLPTIPPPALLASGPDPAASAAAAADLEASFLAAGSDGDPRPAAVMRYRAERGNLLRAARAMLKIVSGSGAAPAA